MSSHFHVRYLCTDQSKDGLYIYLIMDMGFITRVCAFVEPDLSTHKTESTTSDRIVEK